MYEDDKEEDAAEGAAVSEQAQYWVTGASWYRQSEAETRERSARLLDIGQRDARTR